MLAPFYDVILSIDHVSLTCVLWSFLYVINVKNTCKRLVSVKHLAQFLQCNGGKLEESEGYD